MRSRSQTALTVFAATLLVGVTAADPSAKAGHHHGHHARHAVNMSGTSLHRDSASAAPSSASGRVFSGIASFYGNESARHTASGQRFDQNKLTCAHRSLPFGTELRVTHGDRSVIVTVNDRGPFIRGRVLDLSTAAARAVGLTSTGIGLVTAEVISLSDRVWGVPARKSMGTRFGLEGLQIVSKQGECRGNGPSSLFLPRQHSTLVGALVGRTSARTSTTALAVPPGFTARNPCIRARRNNTATVSSYLP